MESQVRSSAAYILFYRRRDTTYKPMDVIYPSIKDSNFIGKPIHTKYGSIGYLVDYRKDHPCPYVVMFQGSMVAYLNEEAILQDIDSDDLTPVQEAHEQKKIAAKKKQPATSSTNSN